MSAQIQFSADATEYNFQLSGKVLLVAHKDNSVVHVSTVENNVDVIRSTLDAISIDHGELTFKDSNDAITKTEMSIAIYSSVDKELQHQHFQEQALEALAEKEKKEKVARFILDMLSTESFDVFYKGIHEAYITGDAGAMDYDEIHEYVVNKFA